MTRKSTVTVEARLRRIGTPPASAGTPRMSLSRTLITTRTLGNKALRSPLAMLRKYLISTHPGLIMRSLSRRISRFEAIFAWGLSATNKTTSS